MQRRLVAIVGPTASGKSEIALQLAEVLGGEIVNADSRQIYRGMDIGTAKPSRDDRRRVRHHLYDIADPSDRYSLALYQRDARAAFEDIWRRGSFPILVGGTGQYVWSLLEAWSVPEVPPDDEVRDRLAAFAREHGQDALHARLRAVDPEAAAMIDAKNVRRVIRALEVFEISGRPISAQQHKGTPDFEYLLFGVDLPRDELIHRINRRVERMYDEGLVEETKALLDAGVHPDASALSSIGYAEAVRHLRREIDRDKAIELTKRATRRLARRQAQWFRREDRRIKWIRRADDAELEANIFTGVCTNVVRSIRY